MRKVWQFPSLGTVPTDHLSIDLLLYTVVHEGHFEITVSFNMHTVNLKSSGETARQNKHNNENSNNNNNGKFVDVLLFGSGEHFNTSVYCCHSLALLYVNGVSFPLHF
jgi:hypothetical protein